jgi:ankyrin repeat protein
MSSIDEIKTRILFKASKLGNKEIIKAMLDECIDLRVKDNGGNTALMWAAWYGHMDIVKLLLDNGADVNVKNNSGNTTLELASFSSILAEDKIVDLLKQAGVTV